MCFHGTESHYVFIISLIFFCFFLCWLFLVEVSLLMVFFPLIFIFFGFVIFLGKEAFFSGGEYSNGRHTA